MCSRVSAPGGLRRWERFIPRPSHHPRQRPDRRRLFSGQIYGEQTLGLYGPLSRISRTTAPVLTYTRGYDGRHRLAESFSFSNPNLPSLSPVAIPHRGQLLLRTARVRAMPWGYNAINWIDQN